MKIKIVVTSLWWGVVNLVLQEKLLACYYVLYIDLGGSYAGVYTNKNLPSESHKPCALYCRYIISQ